ncbi:MAG: hypothetical protein WCO28_10790 [Bacteroidota bacterium]
MFNLIYDNQLLSVADSAKKKLEIRHSLKNVIVENSIDPSIRWRPHMHWVNNYHIFACEISNRPFPSNMNEIHSEVSNGGKPVRIFVAYPQNNNLTSDELHLDIIKAKSYGIGLICISSTNEGTVILNGLPVNLVIPQTTVNELDKYHKKLRPLIKNAIETYIDGYPKHGVQELGQLIESSIRHLAIKAKKLGNYSSGGNPNDDTYSFGNIVDDLIREKIIKADILGKCRGFVEDRNRVSHKPRSIQKALEQEIKLKEDFLQGLRILEDLPKKMKLKNYTFKI